MFLGGLVVGILLGYAWFWLWEESSVNEEDLYGNKKEEKKEI